MKQRLIILTLGLFFSLSTFGQEKIYYDSEWKGCSKNTAEFYRICSFDSSLKPIGEVRDYFITGELQGIAENAIKIDKYDDANSIFKGRLIGYYKNGNKRFEHQFSNIGKLLSAKEYHENGKIISERYLENGVPINSIWYYYHENGKIISEQELENGVPINSIWYYYHDNGKLKTSISALDGKRNGECNFYSEQGKLTTTEYYKEDKVHGLVMWYDENEKIKTVKEYSKGKPVDKFWIQFDNYNNNASKVFIENFSNENTNEWQTDYTAKDVYVNYIQNKGLLFNVKGESGYRNTVKLNIDPHNDFTIKAKLKHISGQKNNGYGIVWGLKDWDNYNYFLITSNGYFMAGGEWDGIKLGTDWKVSAKISSNSNTLTIKKSGDNVFYAINGTLVHSDNNTKLFGTEVGLMNYASKTVRLDGLEVRQEFTRDDLEHLITKNLESSPEIDNSNSVTSEWKGNGTGFFIDKNGYITTNYHVVKDANNIEVEFVRNGIKQTYSAKVIQSDKQNDLSIIKINSSEFEPFTKLPYNFKTNISDVGSSIFALGYPMALSLMGTEIKFTDGKISSKTGIQGDITTYQISVPIQPGNSGGPLFDYDGNLIGITSTCINRELDITENVNYAIKSSYLKNLIDVLDYKLTLPNDRLIANKTLTEKIKILSDYVVLIKIR